jgi:tRNA threonylcarbamoyladenosine biosynthesis protein TsaB
VARVLAIDAASEFASLCVLEDGGESAEVLLHSADGFAHLLFGQLEGLLARTGIRLSDIDCFAAASGPGSFTGVRVALAAAKGLAEACGRPMVAVSNLAAIAWHGSAPMRAAVLDARRGEVYGAVYDAGGGLVRPEVVCPFPAWLADLPHGTDLEIVCTDPAPFASALAESEWASIPVMAAPRGLAGAVARIALVRFAGGGAVDPAGADANYVRRSEAELNWSE